HRGQAYWFDVFNGCVVRYGGDGLFAISNYGIKKAARLFAKKFQSLSAEDIEELGSRPFIFGGIDPYHDEYLLGLPNTEAAPPMGFLDDYTVDANQTGDLWSLQHITRYVPGRDLPDYWTFSGWFVYLPNAS